MRGETGERWRELCQQAAIEQDHQKLMQLVQQINDLLDAKERRLRPLPGNPEGKRRSAS